MEEKIPSQGNQVNNGVYGSPSKLTDELSRRVKDGHGVRAI